MRYYSGTVEKMPETRAKETVFATAITGSVTIEDMRGRELTLVSIGDHLPGDFYMVRSGYAVMNDDESLTIVTIEGGQLTEGEVTVLKTDDDYTETFTVKTFRVHKPERHVPTWRIRETSKDANRRKLAHRRANHNN